MITTNLLTFLISFRNSSEKLIFNVSKDSLNSLTFAIKESNLKFEGVKQFDLSKNKFLKIPNQKLLSIIDHNTELSLLLNDNKLK